MLNSSVFSKVLFAGRLQLIIKVYASYILLPDDFGGRLLFSHFLLKCFQQGVRHQKPNVFPFVLQWELPVIPLSLPCES